MRLLQVLGALIKANLYILFKGMWNGNHFLTTGKVNGKYVFVGVGNTLRPGYLFHTVKVNKIFYVHPDYKDTFQLGHIVDELAEAARRRL